MMQKRILLIGIRPEEARRVFAQHSLQDVEFVHRSDLPQDIGDVAGPDEAVLVLARADDIWRANRLPPASRRAHPAEGSGFLWTHTESPEMIGHSEKIREVCRRIGQVASTDTTVLIEGESGTGKELVARAIHLRSPRAGKPFIKVNRAALPEPLIESELFGHVKGAFTGAIRHREGRFSQARGGTLLLDEIGSIPLASQAKLLRVLQEKEFEPVGSSKTLRAEVRVIATNANLIAAVEAGTFREDLYYRLSVFPIYVPPLRERSEDIPVLAEYFLRKYNYLNQKVRDISAEALELLVNYRWPGNVRQLENAIHHALIVEGTTTIRPSSLPGCIHETRISPTSAPQPVRLREKLNAYEKQLIQQALALSEGKKNKAARMLGIHPKNLARLLRKHNLLEIIKIPTWVINLLPLSNLPFLLDL
ncbi:MAG: sigma-54-dependent Fis family transcriptional regulator [Calditrichaeota bacterium]|nr:MAG: sigma-54-dependent Fis family transcriptional regulator [Calditrichota bacterium]